MTPEQKLKHAIIIRSAEFEEKEPPLVTGENIDELYDELVLADEHWDALYELREGQVETNIPCESSRHYESKSVAAKMPDNSWVGWTYWFGGGKHGEPDAIDWIDETYDLECKEEEVLVVVREFTRTIETT
jgi:hypothetical protein